MRQLIPECTAGVEGRPHADYDSPEVSHEFNFGILDLRAVSIRQTPTTTHHAEAVPTVQNTKGGAEAQRQRHSYSSMCNQVAGLAYMGLSHDIRYNMKHGMIFAPTNYMAPYYMQVIKV